MISLNCKFSNYEIIRVWMFCMCVGSIENIFIFISLTVNEQRLANQLCHMEIIGAISTSE
jgi:hypothetical protein